MVGWGMVKPATRITLNSEEEQTLRGWLRSHKTERRMVERGPHGAASRRHLDHRDRPAIGDAVGTRIKVASPFC